MVQRLKSDPTFRYQVEVFFKFCVIQILKVSNLQQSVFRRISFSTSFISYLHITCNDKKINKNFASIAQWLLFDLQLEVVRFNPDSNIKTYLIHKSSKLNIRLIYSKQRRIIGSEARSLPFWIRVLNPESPFEIYYNHCGIGVLYSRQAV